MMIISKNQELWKSTVSWLRSWAKDGTECNILPCQTQYQSIWPVKYKTTMPTTPPLTVSELIQLDAKRWQLIRARQQEHHEVADVSSSTAPVRFTSE